MKYYSNPPPPSLPPSESYSLDCIMPKMMLKETINLFKVEVKNEIICFQPGSNRRPYPCEFKFKFKFKSLFHSFSHCHNIFLLDMLQIANIKHFELYYIK